jgi:hypothetical protein
MAIPAARMIAVDNHNVTPSELRMARIPCSHLEVRAQYSAERG